MFMFNIEKMQILYTNQIYDSSSNKADRLLYKQNNLSYKNA